MQPIRPRAVKRISLNQPYAVEAGRVAGDGTGMEESAKHITAAGRLQGRTDVLEFGREKARSGLKNVSAIAGGRPGNKNIVAVTLD